MTTTSTMSKLRTSTGRRGRQVTGAAVLGLAILVSSAGVGASSPCFKVKGSYDEHLETDGCQPNGFCIAGEFRGSIKGDFFSTATSFITTDDSEITGVQAFTSDTVIHARLRGATGDLLIKNAGVFQSTGDGNIVDLQTIVDGTGELAGASGVIRASGLFDPTTGSGSSRYEGTVCLPAD